MNNFKKRVTDFLAGRYGSDTINKVLFWICLGLVLTFSFVMIFVKGMPETLILGLVELLLVGGVFTIITLRTFSRNIYARRRENEKFCGFFRLQKNKFRDRKTHVYRKCPKCRAVLRLPKAKGKHSVVCPRCKNRFEVQG